MIMCSLMEEYGMKEYYVNPMNLRKPLYVLEELIKAFYPKVWKHFVRESVFVRG